MKTKTMKKLTALCLMMAMSVWTIGPAIGVASDATTSVTPNYGGGGGGGTDIFVKGKWEMKGHCFDVTGTGTTGDPYVYTYNHCNTVPGGEGQDDSTLGGSQFAPPGIWGENMDYTVCAIVRGPNDVINNIGNVFADIWHPTNRPMHTSGITYDPTNPNISWNDNPVEIDNPSGGCGAHIEQNNLHRLTQQDGWDLVCGELRANNYNLPVWETGYDPNLGGTAGEWKELCGAEGELTKSWAAVYCSDKSLTWEDPAGGDKTNNNAGGYKVTVTAYDTATVASQSNVLENHFTYMEGIGFEKDFSTVDYSRDGNLLIGEDRIISGNKKFYVNSSTTPTVRNTGNVRLNIAIAQDDMGLDKIESGALTGEWRPKYDARVGDLHEDLVDYSPFGFKGETPVYSTCCSGTCGDYVLLDEILDLSEIEEMDFSIRVREKWPQALSEYTGNMWLMPVKAAFGSCGP